MHNRLSALSHKTCFSFAVTFLSVAGGQAAALVGFMFIMVTVDLANSGNLGSLLGAFLLLVTLATATHYLRYGLGRAWGQVWEPAWLRPLNDHMKGIAFKPGMPSVAWAEVSQALEQMPVRSTWLAGSLSLGVVVALIALDFFLAGSARNSLGILRGGLIATVLYAIFSLTIIELLTAPARREARRQMVQLDQASLPRGSSRLSIKLGLFLVLILIGIIITHGLSTSPRTASSHGIIAAFALSILALGLGITILIFRSIIDPLNEIKSSAAVLSRANDAQFISGSREREIVSTAAGFYEYAQKIVEYRRRLQELNPSLEGQVSERTRELREANEALSDSEEKHRTLIEKLQDAVFLIQDGKLVLVNEAFASMTGYSIDELLELALPDIVAPESLDKVIEYYNHRIAGKKVPDHYEFNLLHRDGQTRVTVLMSLGMITSSAGKIYGLGTLKDIGKLKEAELAQEKKARLEGAMALAGAACHELNQPLQAAFSNCEMALLRLEEEGQPIEGLSKVLADLTKLGELTNKIQHITRYETRDYLGEATILDIHKASQQE